MKALFLATIFFSGYAAHAAAPVVSNVRASQRPGTKLVDIYYDVSDADGGTMTVEVNVSGDGGLTYLLPASTFSGAVGPGVSLGSNRHIVWNAGADWNGNFVPSTKVRVTAHDGSGPPAPFNMAYIPAGPFQMGDNLDGLSDAPVHNVNVSAFFMDKYEVTKDLWDVVKAWGSAHGYSIGGSTGKAAYHPAHSLSWYDAVKWCNARSEFEGLTPCYYTDANRTTVYRTGTVVLQPSFVNWNANGYRLPTEAEWEKAARGGIQGWRYPWGDTISHSNANYSGHPIYAGTDPDTAPVGQFAANGYGLFDMAGNVWEWCFDWYATYVWEDDPQGPAAGSYRVLRGGAWYNSSSNCRVASRNYDSPTDTSLNHGFRCVRR